MPSLPANLTASKSFARQALNLSKKEFNQAIHAVKRQIPDNPDVLIDPYTGNVYDRRPGEWIGNLFDEL